MTSDELACWWRCASSTRGPRSIAGSRGEQASSPPTWRTSDSTCNMSSAICWRLFRRQRDLLAVSYNFMARVAGAFSTAVFLRRYERQSCMTLLTFQLTLLLATDTIVHSECRFKLHAMAHTSQLQLKASLSLHCITNRGPPFLFEIVATKTARHKGRWMINHFAQRSQVSG